MKYKIHIVLIFILATINISFLNDNFNYQKHIISCIESVTERERKREIERKKGRRRGEAKEKKKAQTPRVALETSI